MDVALYRFRRSSMPVLYLVNGFLHSIAAHAPRLVQLTGERFRVTG